MSPSSPRPIKHQRVVLLTGFTRQGRFNMRQNFWTQNKTTFLLDQARKRAIILCLIGSDAKSSRLIRGWFFHCHPWSRRRECWQIQHHYRSRSSGIGSHWIDGGKSYCHFQPPKNINNDWEWQVKDNLIIYQSYIVLKEFCVLWLLWCKKIVCCAVYLHIDFVAKCLFD